MGFCKGCVFSLQRWSLVVIVLFIACGLFMFTYHSTQFNGEGFTMVMIASVLSGLRWTLAQLVTQKNEIGNYINYLSLTVLRYKASITDMQFRARKSEPS
jgi:sensor histidine kinase YesM